MPLLLILRKSIRITGIKIFGLAYKFRPLNSSGDLFLTVIKPYRFSKPIRLITFWQRMQTKDYSLAPIVAVTPQQEPGKQWREKYERIAGKSSCHTQHL